MPAALVTIVAFEHQFIGYSTIENWQDRHAQALEQLQTEQKGGAGWFTLERKGIRFAEYVGIIQLPGLSVEILPKADDPNRTGASNGNELKAVHDRWRSALLGMLRQVLNLPLAVPGPAGLAAAPHKMLDVFLAAFVQQADGVFRAGLVKHYHSAEGNRSALKGQLMFGQHLNQNLLHKERFFTRHQVYDRVHPLNCLLRMALQVAADQAYSAAVSARARTLLLHWPELPQVKVPQERPVLNRKTAHYGPALDLALLLLRANSPSLQQGKTQALALLFDMNSLYEEYVETLLRRAAAQAGAIVQPQTEKRFWATIKARPDVVVSIQPTPTDPRPARTCIVDMKWKVPKGGKPTPDDIRQVYAYCHLWGAQHGLLLYPWVSEAQQPRRGAFASSQLATAGTVITGQTMFARVLLPNHTLNPNLGRETLQALRSLE
ncbi:McrC family protein [Hymenobacter guriensis]|uniref:Restriction endonuclease n=1 Tax=Hymenobacter guriensis TaxID=2793065 RepID=A0ABS0L9B1_9BACT|nr:hypothetical protein [Hymenobacter guriensis]MBG8556094.1 hypothetical protein [Hymenobacter guriensis]